MSLEKATETIKSRAESSESLGSVLKFTLDEGVILLDGSGDKNVVSNEDREADCTIGMSLGDLSDMLSGDLDPISAFMGGKLKVEGDMSVAMKLQSLM